MSLHSITALLLTTLLSTPALAQPATDGAEPTVPSTEEPQLARAPQLKQLVPAEVPQGTRFPSPEVQVVLDIEVDEQGRTGPVTLVQGAGEPFDSAALAAARRFEWEPAVLTNGERVPVPVSFQMRIQEPPPPPPPPARLVGRLVERGTRIALSGVELVARREGRTLARAVTDDAGRFELEIPPEPLTVVGVPAGHERLEVELALVPGERREEIYYLEKQASGYETVVRAQTVRREVSRQVLTAETVATVAGTQGDTLKVVQNLPGVARASFGGGQLILRGAAPGDSLTYLEGQEIPSLYHFGGLRSTFNSAFLDSVDFYPGNFAPDFGRALGGVVEVKARDPAQDLFRGQVDLNVFDGGLHLEGPVAEGLSIGAAFHRSWIDSVLPLVLPEDVPLSFNSAPRYYDYQLVASWRPAPKQRLRVLFFGTMDKVAILFDRPASDPQGRGALEARVWAHSLQASYRSELAPWLSQESSLQLSTQRIDTQIGPSAYFNLGVERMALRSTWTAEASSWLSLRAGLDWRYDLGDISLNVAGGRQEGEPPVPGSTQQRFAADKSFALYAPALFTEVRLAPLDSLLVLPSARVDYYGQLGKWTVDPRLAVRWELRAGTTLAGGLGLFQQPPDPAESDPDTGNPALGAERALHASLGVEQRLREGLELTATGFYKSLDRLVVRNPLRATDSSQPYYTNDGTGRIYGVELQLKAQIGTTFQGWLAYTFQRSLRTDGFGREERAFDFDQPHILTAVGTWTFGGGWSAGGRFRLISGNPTTPVTGALFDAASGPWVPRYGAVNSERLPLFHPRDLRGDKRFAFETWQLAVYLDVQNVYNRGNAEGYSYGFDYTQRQPITGLPILPVVGIRGEW